MAGRYLSSVAPETLDMLDHPSHGCRIIYCHFPINSAIMKILRKIRSFFMVYEDDQDLYAWHVEPPGWHLKLWVNLTAITCLIGLLVYIIVITQPV